MRCVVKSTSVPRFCDKFSSNEDRFHVHSNNLQWKRRHLKTLQRRVKTGWANCLLHQTERAASAGSPLFVEYTKACIWKTTCSHLMEQEKGDSTVISITKLFRSLAGWKNEFINLISGYKKSATSPVWNYGEATVKLSSTLSMDFF